MRRQRLAHVHRDEAPVGVPGSPAVARVHAAGEVLVAHVDGGVGAQGVWASLGRVGHAEREMVRPARRQHRERQHQGQQGAAHVPARVDRCPLSDLNATRRLAIPNGDRHPRHRAPKPVVVFDLDLPHPGRPPPMAPSRGGVHGAGADRAQLRGVVESQTATCCPRRDRGRRAARRDRVGERAVHAAVNRPTDCLSSSRTTAAPSARSSCCTRPAQARRGRRISGASVGELGPIGAAPYRSAILRISSLASLR